MKKYLMSLSMTAALILGMSAVLSAAVPPPPANQSLYIYDTKFGTFVTEDCENCHGGPDPNQDKQNAVLVTLHHNLIPQASGCYNVTGTLPATLATGCHVQVPAAGGGYTFQDFRNCLNCHTGQSPHHNSAFAAAQDCQHCHGTAIDNPKDGHYIPSYAINTDATKGGVTPAPHGRTVADPANPGKNIIVQGCAACHQADTTATPQIYGNNDLHHGTNIGGFVNKVSFVGDCTWCHDQTTSIRGCEQCHGVKSLHNIQADSTNAANLGKIVPGNEALGYGHIGNNWDCNGCHWSWTGSDVNPETAATVPSIGGLSTKVVTAGTQTELIITGGSFVNSDSLDTMTYAPSVTLARNGNTITLTPFSYTTTEVKVLLPGLQQGDYELRVVKNGSTFSNLATLVVAPNIAIKAAMLSGNTVTITGDGLGSAPTAETKAYLGVFTGTTQAKIVSWDKTKIVAYSPAFAGGKTVTVKTLYGSAAGTMFVSAKKAR